MRLFIVRHGETAWNRAGRFQGRMDIPLNENGLAQAVLTAKRFSGFKFDAVLSSPLSRARVTGEKIYDEADCSTFITDDGFMEISHGDWEGHLRPDVESRWPDILDQWLNAPEICKMPGAGGESLADVTARAVEAVERIAFDYSGDVMLATHDAVAKTLICYYVGIPLENYWRIKVPNCSVSFIEFGKSPQLGLLGDVSHLGCGFDTFASKSL